MSGNGDVELLRSFGVLQRSRKASVSSTSRKGGAENRYRGKQRTYRLYSIWSSLSRTVHHAVGLEVGKELLNGLLVLQVELCRATQSMWGLRGVGGDIP